MNDDIERLIVRHLDGELDEDEELELSRALLRDPQSRDLAGDYGLIDRLAAESLSAALGTGMTDSKVVPFAIRHDGRRARRNRWGWLLVSGAAAAALLALVIPRPVFQEGGLAERQVVQSTPAHGEEGAGRTALEPAGGAPMRTVSTPQPERVQRATGREVIGVVGDDGNVYWIEIDRTHTIKRPPRPVRTSGGGI